MIDNRLQPRHVRHDPPGTAKPPIRSPDMSAPRDTTTASPGIFGSGSSPGAARYRPLRTGGGVGLSMIVRRLSGRTRDRGSFSSGPNESNTLQ